MSFNHNSVLNGYIILGKRFEDSGLQFLLLQNGSNFLTPPGIVEGIQWVMSVVSAQHNVCHQWEFKQWCYYHTYLFQLRWLSYSLEALANTAVLGLHGNAIWCAWIPATAGPFPPKHGSKGEVPGKAAERPAPPLQVLGGRLGAGQGALSSKIMASPTLSHHSSKEIGAATPKGLT